MRTLKFKIQTALIIVLTIITVNSLQAQMLIKPDGDETQLNSYAMLQIESSTKGFLIPRMTKAQRESISLPPQGLLVFQTDDGTNAGLYYATGTGNNWTLIFHSNTTAITGTGTSNYLPYWTGTNVLGNSGMYWDNTNSRLGIGTTSPTSILHLVDATNRPNAITISKTGAVTNNSYGMDITVSGGTCWNEGIIARAQGTGSVGNVGVYTIVDGAAPDNYGFRTQVSGGTSENYGIHTVVSGSTGSTYGGYFDNTSTSTSHKYGVYVNTTGNSSGNNYGGVFSASGSTSNNMACYGSAGGSTGTNNYGGYFQSTLTGGTSNYGVYGKSIGVTTGTNIGGYFTASGSSTGNYGLLVDAGNVGIGTLTPIHKLDVVGELGIGNQTTAYDNTTSQDFGGLVIQNYKETGFGVTTNIVATGILTGNWQSEMAFHTRNNSGTVTEKMRITDDGNVGIGTTTPSYPLHVTKNSGNYTALIQNLNGTTSSNGLLIQAGSSTTGGATFIGFNMPNGTRIGSITQSGISAVAYNTSSDRRLKDNIVNTHFGINDLMKIQVRDYFYKADPNKTPTTGFIAQELYDIFPNAVTKPANEEEMWSIDYGKVTPLLTKAIQEQQTEITSLKSEIEQMKSDIQQLKSGNLTSTAGFNGNNVMVFSVIGFAIAGLVLYGFKKSTKS